jgi:hypothetical protein
MLKLPLYPVFPEAIKSESQNSDILALVVPDEKPLNPAKENIFIPSASFKPL